MIEIIICVRIAEVCIYC